MNFDLALCPLPVSGNAFADAVLRDLFAPAAEAGASHGNPGYRLIDPEPGKKHPPEHLIAHRWIFLVRDLRDITQGFARHLLELGPPTVPAGYSFADAVEMVISHALPSVVAELSLLKEQVRGTWIRYEELLTNPVQVFAHALSELGIDVDRSSLEAATERHRHLLGMDAVATGDRSCVDTTSGQLFRIFLGAAQLALGYRLDDLPPEPTPNQRRLSFFQARRAPYYIWADSYRQSSAGIRSLHYLCHALNELGQEAYVTPAPTCNPSLRTPRLTREIVRQHFTTGRTPIAIYPEVVSGNPLAAPTVARWLLNRPGHIGGDTHFDSNDLIFHFARWCIPEGTHDSAILNLPTVDTAVFNNDDNPLDSQRKGICYYANKFLAAGGRIAPEIAASAISLGLETPRAPHELAEIFRQSEALLCYELSSMIPEALSCGCPVLIMPSEYWDRHGDPGILNTRGIALANEPGALERANREVAAFRCTDDRTANYYWWQIERFIARTQQRAQQEMPMPATPWHRPKRERHRHLEEIERLYAGRIAAEGQTGDAAAPTPATGARVLARLPVAKLPSLELIIVATEPGRSLLAATLASLDAQDYPALTVTVIAPPATIDTAAGNGRRCLPQSENHWQAACEALAASTAAWAGIVRSGDTLGPGTLAAFAGRMIDPAAPDVLYSDATDSAVDGGAVRPHFLPDFDIDLVRAGDFPFGLLLARTDRWRDAGGWREAPAGLDTLDATLRLHESCGTAAIGHVAGTFLVRHRNNQPYLPTDPRIVALRRQIVAEHLLRSGDPGQVVGGLRDELVHIRYPVAQLPKVSLIIPTKDNGAGLETCILALTATADYPNLECLLIDNGTVEPGARAYLDNLKTSASGHFRVVAFPHPFNFGAIAAAAAEQASGDLLLFLHDDVEALQPGWIHALVEQCLRPGVGIAGGRLLARSGMLAEAGIVPMQTGLADSPFAGLSPDARVTASRLQVAHQVSAVSSACLMVRREIFREVGGMDAVNFPARAADIDFCLTVRHAGYRIMWTPYATLQHDSDGSLRGNKNDSNALLAKWGPSLVDDPTFNPCLALDGRQEAPETDQAFIPDSFVQPGLPRIFGAGTASSATGHKRLLAPLRSATEAGTVRGRWAEFLPLPIQLARLGTDLLHSLPPATPRQLHDLSVCKRLLGCPVVMDIDDLIDRLPHGEDPVASIAHQLKQYGPIADTFTTSSRWLADRLADSNRPLVVIPDAIDAALWHLPCATNDSKRLRVVWHGDPADLEAIMPAVMSLASTVDWVFIGEFPEILRSSASEIHLNVSRRDLPAKLASLKPDLAICPLAMTLRNHCRSDISILEYGALGIPVVATDIDAYRTGLPITLTDNTLHGWTEAVRAHADDRAAGRRKGETLREHVLAHRTLKHTMGLWLRAWQSVKHSPAGAGESPDRPSPSAAAPDRTWSIRSGTASLQAAYPQWLATRNQAIADSPSLLPGESALAPVAFHLILRQPDGNTAALAETLENLGHQRHPHWHIDVITPLPPPEGIESVPSVGWHDSGEGAANRRIDALVRERNADWIIELPPGAVLDPVCLWRLVAEARRHPDALAFFVDDDCYDGTGTRMKPRFKPGVNIEQLKSSDLAGPLFVKREAWLAAGGAPSHAESPWFGQLLRIAERFGWLAIRHVPDVLISYPDRFPSSTETCLTELARHLLTARLEPHFSRASETGWHIGYKPVQARHVTICIASQGRLELLNRTVTSLLDNTDYPSFDIVIGVPDEMLDAELAQWLDDCHRLTGGAIRHLAQEEGNFFGIQVGQLAASASGEYILLAEEGMTVQDKSWLRELAGVLDQPDVAAASPMIVDPATGELCSAGRVLGLAGAVGTPHPDAHASGGDVAILPGQCLLARKRAYDEQGGLSGDYASRDLAIADLCLRWRENSLRLVCTALSKVLCADFKLPDLVADKEQQHLSAQVLAREEAGFIHRWLKNGVRDDYWNPNLSLAEPEAAIESRYAAQWSFVPAEWPKIVARPVPNSQGDYRINYYLDALLRAGKAGTCTWQQPLDDPRQPTPAEICRLGADSLVVQNYTLAHHLETLRSLHHLATRPFIVHTLDDLLTNLDPNSPFTALNPPDTRSRLKYALAHSDRLVVSTHYLAESFRHLIDDIRVVPNRLPGNLWLPLNSKRHTGKRPRIGWAGGITHHTDLMLLKEVILETRDEADWIFFGMSPPELRPLLAEFHAFAPREEYPQRLAALNLDLAVAPLADIPFNQAKSNLRLLEYGILGIPVVCSDVEPYRDSPACRVENTAERWIAALRERIHDPDAREAEGRMLRRWVHEHFLIESHMEEWLAAHLP